MEREHERDEFQQEIRRLEAQLRHTGNGDNKAHKVRAVTSGFPNVYSFFFFFFGLNADHFASLPFCHIGRLVLTFFFFFLNEKVASFPKC